MAGERKLRLKTARGGGTALEYALLLPALLLLTAGTMEIGRLMWTYTTLNRAVEAAARCGAINTADCGTAEQVQSRAVAEAWGLPVPASVFTVTYPACGVRVTASYEHALLIPWPGGAGTNAVTLTASACYPM